jgi:S-formylglutathione hydrolase FrmB
MRNSSAWFVSLVAMVLAGAEPPRVLAQGIFKHVPNPEGRFAGQVLDLTANHGADRRLWSNALQEKRDLYVYLPPGFDAGKRYPFIFWLHGIVQDEKGFLTQGLPEIDAAMACGRLPPAIIAIPDGSLRGRPGYFSANSAFLNTRAGRFEDYLFDDIYAFVRQNFPLRDERQAHVLAGVSIGGAAAFRHAIARRDEFAVVVGIFPPLNVRWLDCHGHYFANFDPENWGWREHYHLGLLPVGKFYCGLVQVPWRRLVHPLYGHGNQVIPQMSRDNPIEMLDTYDLGPGELDMLVAYGGKDEFNVDAQVESFLYRSKEKGLAADVIYDPRGRHNAATALGFLPGVMEWLAARLEPFRPDSSLHAP